MPVETRYMRGDTHTVNGLTAYVLGTSQSTLARGTYIVTELGWEAKAGIRVWKRNVNGVETEITNGSPVAVVSRIALGSGIQSATWNCPQTSLSPTDAIVVRVYLKPNTGDWELKVTFITEQLGATVLEAATWTVYYWTNKAWSAPADAYIFEFRWGTSTYNSRIENFSWSSIALVKKFLMDGLVFIEW